MTHMNKDEVTEIIREECGFAVGEAVKVSSDGCEGHLRSGPWETWTARAGEFSFVVMDFGDGNYSVNFNKKRIYCQNFFFNILGNFLFFI